MTLLINGSGLIFDAFGEELEELLGILVLAGGEQGIVFARGVVG